MDVFILHSSSESDGQLIKAITLDGYQYTNTDSVLPGCLSLVDSGSGY